MFKCNEYFDGKGKTIAGESRLVLAPRRHSDIMRTYDSRHQAPETVTVVGGELIITLPDSSTAQHFYAGENFDVPSDSAFDVHVLAASAYLCLYG
ncbi:hypothetical protein MNBD_GAMMA20-735 [hydrothermal vent metagenome]|uniref:Cytoplasmic protein n=1 Tax=hydrothermal vent metagenome TaxID=652676 RepID=A0A3B1A2U4_9ZZZZ